MPANSITPTEVDATALTNTISELVTQYLTSTTSTSPLRPSSAGGVSPSLHTTLPPSPLGLAPLTKHLTTSLLPHLISSSTSPHYYGFVTGGITPAAYVADILVTTVDQNVQVHLPLDTAATLIEDAACVMLLELFTLSPTHWTGRIITTGATASNILGLATAREVLLHRRLVQAGYAAEEASVAELGVLEACIQSRTMGVKVFTAGAHSSVAKAAAILGLGRAAVEDISLPDQPWEFDLPRLTTSLAAAEEKGMVCIIVATLGEINTGRSCSTLPTLRTLANKHSAWIHVDAAFGIFARLLPGVEDGLEHADSITGDGHKLLNVPYDSGFFFTPHLAALSSTFKNVAPYLTASAVVTQPSPLNIGLENSRRFRALPVYASVLAYGRQGYAEMVVRMVAHARGIARVIAAHPGLELLPAEEGTVEERVGRVFIVVLFRAREEERNVRLRESINKTGRMYVTGTKWEGRDAVRCAVANWRVRGEREGEGGWGVVEEVLGEVMA